MANNPIIYNAIIAGVTGGSQQRWPPEPSSNDYSMFAVLNNTIATAIDAAIDTDPTINLSHGNLMQSICQGIFSSRSAHTLRHDLPALTEKIRVAYLTLAATLETEFGVYSSDDITNASELVTGENLTDAIDTLHELATSTSFDYEGFELSVTPDSAHTGTILTGDNAQHNISLAPAYWYSITVEVVIKNSTGPAYYIYRQQIEAYRDGGGAIIHYQPTVKPIEYPIAGNYSVTVSAVTNSIRTQINNASGQSVSYSAYIGFTRKPIPV